MPTWRTEGVDLSVSTAATADGFRQRFLHNLRYLRGLELAEASAGDHMAALVLTVRERLVDRAAVTAARHRAAGAKTVYYLSMEYLLGRLLRNNLLATGTLDTAREALAGLGLDLEALLEEESDPGLGNGGLGRLAACFLDSLATLDYPAVGYGLRYDYGIFRQEFHDGWQAELPDRWLKGGHPWGIHRSDLAVPLALGGSVTRAAGASRADASVWSEGQSLLGMPHDVLVAGYATDTVAILRLWRAEAPDEFDFEVFSQGDFLRAVAARERAEAITKVLYPSDAVEAGRELRLTQEYFLVGCSVRDIVRRFRSAHGDAWYEFPDRVALQLNDTHPALAVAELMRVFVDEAGLRWSEAWPLVVASCGYTNHTLLPEALETWPVGLVERLLPRHAEIIYEINKHLLAEVGARYPADLGRLNRVSLVHEDGERRFRMAHLAITGSHRTNGVAKLHTHLLTTQVVPDFAELWPERFLAITNGITPRRWLLACNPRLAAAISRRIGDGWACHLDRLSALRPFAQDPEFQREFLAIKAENKRDLAREIQRSCQLTVDPASLFDVLIKRLHEYKRQLLQAMHVIALIRRVRAGGGAALLPRTFVFGAKAAPSYRMAKLIIRLINGLGETINEDPVLARSLRVAFLPDYRVTLAERIIPAADLSEQISTAGKEASGTGNMKLALNGALTIGTLDGATIEIRDAVGADNIFIFGHTAGEVERLRSSGGYDPWRLAAEDDELAGVLDDLHDGTYLPRERDVSREIWGSLMERGDPYLHIADFRPFLAAQARAEALFADPPAWAAAAIANIAAMGTFSSDRAVREYAEQVWGLSPVPPAASP